MTASGHDQGIPSSNPPRERGRAATTAGRVFGVVVLASTVLAFAASRLAIAGIPSEREYDEGVYLLSARSLLAGNELFGDIFSSQPPAFLETLALAMRLFGDSLWTGRMVALAFSLAALVAIADLGRRLAGSVGAGAAAVALALSVTFLDLGHVVQAETPALAVALASLCCCLEARRRDWNGPWLAATGALFALALLFKLFVAPLALPLALLLLLDAEREPGERWRLGGRGFGLAAAWTRRASLVAAGALPLLALPLLGYDRSALLEQTVWFHVDKHEAYELHRNANLRRIAAHLVNDAAVTASAVAGLLLLAWRDRLRALWLLAWVGVSVLALVEQTPLFWRHFVLLSMPAALAAAALPALLPGHAASRARLAMAGMLLFAWCAGSMAWSADQAMFPWIAKPSRWRDEDHPLRLAVRWLREHSQPEELIVSDDPLAVFLAGRQSPPGLCDTSQARIHSKSLQLRDAARQTMDARIVMLRKNGRLSSLGGYVTWLHRNYRALPRARTGLGDTRSLWIRQEEKPPSATRS